MCLAIAECHRVDEVKDIRDKAMALEVYARQSMNIDAERLAAAVRLRAERRAGQLLTELRRSPVYGGGDTTPRSADVAERSEYREAIERAGISPRTATRFQEFATVPEEVFEAHLGNVAAKPSVNGIMRAVNGATTMDDGSLWIWGRLRDFERDKITQRPAADVLGGMTDSMQADVRRILPGVLDWLIDLREASGNRTGSANRAGITQLLRDEYALLDSSDVPRPN